MSAIRKARRLTESVSFGEIVSDLESFAEESVALAAELTVWWWALAFLFFGVGDVATSLIGLQSGAVFEASPVYAGIVSEFGSWTIVPFKAGIFAVLSLCWRVVPAPHRIGIPIGLTGFGIFITGWNCAVLAHGI